MTTLELVLLLVVATIGHVMALVWLSVEKFEIDMARVKIYDLPTKNPQLRRELKNSIHTPMHAIILACVLWFGLFENRTFGSFLFSLFLTAIIAEIWHYFSHRAFHLKSLHWIHAEHHKSRLSTPFTALSFSFMEKLIFDAGIIGLLMLADLMVRLNFYGVGAWFISYLVVNSFGHANYEFSSKRFENIIGRYLTSAIYHSLHHSRYTGNYGLATRFLDKWFGTEWPDSEAVIERVVKEKRPMKSLGEIIK